MNGRELAEEACKTARVKVLYVSYAESAAINRDCLIRVSAAEQAYTRRNWRARYARR